MKIKILLAFLGIVTLVAVGLAAWIYISSQAQVSEYAKKQAELEKQTTYLQEKLDVTRKETRHWREKSEAVTVALDRLGKEHTLLLGQYNSLLKEKDSLVEDNKSLGEQLERLNKLYTQEREKAKIDTSDKFLASLLKEKAHLEVEIEKLKAKISSQEFRLEDIEKQARPASEKIERLQKEKHILEEKFQDAQKVSDILSNGLLKERKRRTALEEELARTEGRLISITREKDKLSEQLVKMKQALEQRLAELSQTKKVLESAVEGAGEVVKKAEPASIELPPIVVKAQEETPAFPPIPPKLARAQIVEEETFKLIGSIITINDKHRFVVIDMGRDDGVEKGMSFDVYRKDQRLGRVEVIETRKSIAACDIKEINVRHLKVNDTVRR